MAKARSNTSTSVMIVGAGPVGLTLAAELGRRDIACVVVEEAPGTKTRPRAMGVGPRSMEHFRRWGIAENMYDAGVPRDMAPNIVYVTRLCGHMLARFDSPSANALAARAPELVERLPEIAHSPYYRTWCAQHRLEAVICDYVRTLPSVELRFGWRLETLDHDADGARARIVEVATGNAETLDAGWFVGCDGARSATRKALDIALDGRGTMGEVWATHFRAPSLMDTLTTGPGVMFWVMAPGCDGVVYTLDGREEWWMNKYYPAGEGIQPIDPAAQLIDAIGADIPVEVISCQAFDANQLVADRFVAGRVLLAGDAAHIFVPPGGLGMNTGIDDAVNLGWKLAACVEGWAGPALLQSYEDERRPVGIRNTNRAADSYQAARRSFDAPPEIEDRGAQGARIRSQWSERVQGSAARQHAIVGAQLGVIYHDSPICVPDDPAPGGPAPGEPPGEPTDEIFTQSARPGSRAPHAWLADGRSTLDLFGERFTLLRFGAADFDTTALERAARAAGAPLAVADVDDAAAAELYELPLVLVRPDGHVAWRARRPPADPEGLIDRVRGAAPAAAVDFLCARGPHVAE